MWLPYIYNRDYFKSWQTEFVYFSLHWKKTFFCARVCDLFVVASDISKYHYTIVCGVAFLLKALSRLHFFNVCDLTFRRFIEISASDCTVSKVMCCNTTLSQVTCYINHWHRPGAQLLKYNASLKQPVSELESAFP